MNVWEVVIGLETHLQLRTESKLFCGCSTRFDAAPNRQVCPVCLGDPGSLPVANRRAVELAIRLGLALGATVRERSRFDRKNYFYPDLPKGYQITQYDEPLCEGGRLQCGEDAPAVPIRRIHLEEDAGRSAHVETLDGEETRIDLNRCGVPLAEVVTEPFSASPQSAIRVVEKLRELSVWLGVCDGNMAQGSLRCDANVSLRRAGEARLGEKTELKNLNSFRFLREALAEEISRQKALLDSGGQVRPETLGFDERRKRLRPLRVKEEDSDYRYLPEPDLPPLLLEREWIETIRREMPELPDERRARYAGEFGLGENLADRLTRDRRLGERFEEVVGQGLPAAVAAQWIVEEVQPRLARSGADWGARAVDPTEIAQLILSVEEGRLSRRLARDILDRAVGEGALPSEIIAAEQIELLHDDRRLVGWIEEVCEQNPDVVERYRAGKSSLLRFLIGEVVRRSEGRADPQDVERFLRRHLGGEGKP